jgi:hypothetical protein
VGPSLKVSPAAISFGQVDVGQTSAAQVVTVTNTGTLVALSPAVQGTGFAMTDTNCGVAAASCTISIKFAPAAVGGASGTLTVATGLAVSLSGLGSAPGTFTVTSSAIPTTLFVSQSASISVTVTATAALPALSCVPSGGDLTADATKTTCTGAMAASTPCVYAFTFKATTPGDKNDSIVCTAGTDSKTVLVGPTVVTPASLSLTPNPGTFSVAVGSTSDAVIFNLANVGGSVSGTLSTALAGANADQFTILNNKCVVPLVSLGICEIQVVFKPTTAGAKTATITVTDATAGSTPASAVLNGTAVGTPVVAVTGTGNLGSVAVGKAGTPSTFTVTNSGAAPTGVLTVTGSDPQFAIGSDLCSAAALGAGKTCTFTVTFSPTAAGATSAVLNISSGGTVLGTLQIQGTGTSITPPVLGMTPASLDFGTIGVGTVSAAQNFTLANTGGTATGPLTVVKSDIAAGPGGASQFSYTTTCQAALAPAATCQVVVTFKPTITGNASASFTVTDGTVSSVARTVSGSALDRPGVGIACLPSSFEDTAVGATSAAVVCTVTNSASSKQDTGTLTATTTGDFAVTTNGCSASLAPGLTCTLSVVFKPTVSGARTGTVSVSGTNGGVANQTLTGTGLGIVEIQEFTAVGSVPTLVQGGNYDFGTVSAGATSATTVILAVFVRAPVGNLSVAKAFGTPADFTQLAGAVSLTWPGTATPTSVPACVALTTTAPPASKTVPYCTLAVKFTPQSKAATKTGTVTASGADGTTTTATVHGSAAGPISISPSPLTFAAVPRGTAGVAMTLTMCNTAATPATGAQFAISGAKAGDFTVTLDQVTGATIAANSCVNLAVRLDVPATETATSLSATLTVSATVAGVVETDVATLVGTATGGGEVLQLSIPATGFADTAITDTSPAAVVTVTNAGGQGTGGLTFTLPAGSEFSMRNGTLAQGSCAPTCTANGLTCTAPALAAAGSCTLRVWFSPTGALGIGSRTDTLRASSDTGAVAVLPLSANALGQLTATPATVTLGASGVGGVPAPTSTITVGNVGAADATLTLAFKDFGVQTGAAAAAFAFVSDGCTGALSAQDTCTVGVKINTAAPVGTFSTTVVVTNTLNGQSTSVVVNGTVAEAVLRFTAATAAIPRDFGTIPRDSTSAPFTYTVKNVGTLASGLISFNVYDQIAGTTTVATTPHAKTTDFLFTGSTCVSGTTTLAPGATCNISLAFNPTSCDAGATGCTQTATSLTEYLVVQAAPGTATAGLVSPVITAGTTAPGVVYVADTSVPPNPVYDFGSATAAKTVVLAIYNATGASYTVPTAATAITYPNIPGLTGVVTPGAGEFTTPTTAGSGTCKFAGGSVTTLAAATIAAPQSCTFTVSWTPGTTAAAGTRAVAVTVGTGGPTMNLYARVPGTPALVANPSALNFGNVSATGNTSSTLTLTVTNTGDGATGGVNVATAPATNEINYSTAAPACGSGPLAAGTSCNLVVTLNPGSAAAGSANITVRTPTTGTIISSVVVPVTWTGTNTNPAAINLDPAPPYNFGSMAILATSVAQTITLTNPARGMSTGPLAFAVDNPDFAVKATGTGSCGDAAHADGLVPTAAADSCTVTVTFTPRAPLGTAPDNRVGHLTITSTYVDPPVITLSGRAVAALSVSDNAVALTAEDPLVAGPCTFTDASGTTPAACAYASRPVTATTFRSETFTFQNATGAPSTGLLEADLTGTGAAQFRIVADTCTGNSVDSGLTCKVTVRFAPSSAGAKAATLTVSGTPGDSASVTLTGTGT